MKDPDKSDSVAALRAVLLGGSYAPGDHIGEAELAEILDVSRTLVRIAMTALENEGLLIRRPNRGCILRGYTVAEVSDAIEVRGELEGMAARKLAEAGLSETCRAEFRRILAEGDRLIGAGFDALGAQESWLQLNSAFHETLIRAAGITPLTMCIDRLDAIPLAGADAVLLNKGDTRAGARQLTRSQEDHHAVFAALEAGAGHRAESLMREHAFRSAANKRANLKDAATRAAYKALPGLRLILADAADARPFTPEGD